MKQGWYWYKDDDEIQWRVVWVSQNGYVHEGDTQDLLEDYPGKFIYINPPT